MWNTLDLEPGAGPMAYTPSNITVTGNNFGRCERYKQERLEQGIHEEIVNVELLDPDFML